MTLIQIQSQYFTACIELNPEGRVVDAAPILAYMKGWDNERVYEYTEQKGWKREIVIPYTSEALHGKTKITLPQGSRDITRG